MAPPVPGASPFTDTQSPFRQLLDVVDAFIYATDINGNYTFANRQVLDLLGGPSLTLEQVLGRAFTDFVDIGEAGETLRATDRQVLEQGEVIAREEANLIHATGELRHYWSVKRPLRDAQGGIIGLLGISYDITEKKQLAEKAERQKALLDTILDNIAALVYVKDRGQKYLYANRPVAEMFGLSREGVVGKTDWELFPQEVAQMFRDTNEEIFATGKKAVTEENLLSADGSRHHYWNVAVPCITPEGIEAIVGTSTDITDLHRLKERLRRQAETDSLTGIANRRHFFEPAEKIFAQHKGSRSLALIAIDVDHFKQINDSHGHPVGDEVLRHFARCCGGRLRSRDLFSRTGGEEFCILLPDTTLADAHQLAERIRQQVHEKCKVTEHRLHITISLGVAAMQAGDANFTSLFRRADSALYQAKGAGRNRVCVAE